jgi:hypothetical protein
MEAPTKTSARSGAEDPAFRLSAQANLQPETTHEGGPR